MLENDITENELNKLLADLSVKLFKCNDIKRITEFYELLPVLELHKSIKESFKSILFVAISGIIDIRNNNIEEIAYYILHLGKIKKESPIFSEIFKILSKMLVDTVKNPPESIIIRDALEMVSPSIDYRTICVNNKSNTEERKDLNCSLITSWSQIIESNNLIDMKKHSDDHFSKVILFTAEINNQMKQVIGKITESTSESNLNLEEAYALDQLSFSDYIVTCYGSIRDFANFHGKKYHRLSIFMEKAEFTLVDIINN